RAVYPYAGVDAAETNLAGTGITLGAALGVGPDDQAALRTRFFDPAFLGTGWMTKASILYNHASDYFGSHQVFTPERGFIPYAVVHYTRAGGSIGAGHDLGIANQLWFDLRVEKIKAEIPLAASHLRGLDREPILFNLLPGDSVLSTLRGTFIRD